MSFADFTPRISTSSKAYYPALTGLRAIAAWLVFFHHFAPFELNSIGWRVTRQWYMGVSIFFVLSGLLICARYLGRVEISRSWGLAYLRKRVARIYPMYLLVTCATFFTIHLSPAYDMSETWASLSRGYKVLVFGLNVTFLRGFFEYVNFTGIIQGWTLTVEECFYLAAPFLLLGLRSKPWRLAVYALMLMGIGSVLVLAAPHPYGFFNTFAFMLVFTFFGRCGEFLAGMGLALLLLSKCQAWGRFYTWGGIAWIGAFMAVMVWVDNTALPDTTASPLYIFLKNMLLVPGVCALLYGLVRERTMVRRLLESRLFDLLGKASYTFYLIHMGIVSQFFRFHVTNNVFIIFLGTNLLAIGLYKWVEEPLHRWIGGHRNKVRHEEALTV